MLCNIGGIGRSLLCIGRCISGTREDITGNFRKLINDVSILNVDILLRGLEIFDRTPKLDFVDCLLYGYKWEKGIDIVTFDKKLQRRLGEVIL